MTASDVASPSIPSMKLNRLTDHMMKTTASRLPNGPSVAVEVPRIMVGMPPSSVTAHQAARHCRAARTTGER